MTSVPRGVGVGVAVAVMVAVGVGLRVGDRVAADGAAVPELPPHAETTTNDAVTSQVRVLRRLRILWMSHTDDTQLQRGW
jgi:hypothetical protein